MAANLLCVWWLIENSMVHCFTFDFLLGVTRTAGRRNLPIWLVVNGAATLAVIFFQPPAAFLFSVLTLGIFAKIILNISSPDLIVPMAVILTLCTLKEGFSALFLSWISVSFRSPTGGIGEQLLIPLLLDVLLFVALRTVKKHCPLKLERSIFPYLYIFLPACVFAILAIRWGLRLDYSDFEPYLAAFNTGARLSAFYLMIGAAVVIFIAFGTFGRMVYLSEREKLLENQLAAINGHNRSYAAFQHDINNHLLVISGLLRERSFARAEQYANQLKASCEPLHSIVSTGNLALDVLLREKLDAAKRSHITVVYDVCLGGFSASDTDLCALFSNILDNAIAACLNEPEDSRYLSLSAKVRSQFLVVEAINTASADGPVLFGTGLNNIRRIAENYQGTMETELSSGRFRISVLLCSR